MSLNRLLTKPIKVLIIIGLFIFIILGHLKVNAAEKEFDIVTSTKANGYFMEIENLQPGDTIKRKLTIQNRGNQNFTYKTESRFLNGGSEELYDEFLLKVLDSDEVLYEGLLKDFNGLQPRFLKSTHQEDLEFQLEFPNADKDQNHLQGKKFEVEFKFIVEGSDPGGPGDPGDPNDSDDPTDPEDPKDPQGPNDPDDPNTPDNTNDPDDPNNPENPTPPTDPSEPVDPTNPSEPHDPDELMPQHPIDPEELYLPPTDGQILPSTSTNIFNFVFAGFALITGGGILHLLSRRRKTRI